MTTNISSGYRFVDTANRKNTLHDTVGTIFLNTDTESDTISNTKRDFNDVMSDGNASDSKVGSSSKKRKSTFNALDIQLQPYSRKLKLIKTLPPLDFPSRPRILDLKKCIRLDVVWMVNNSSKIPNTPIWF